MRGLAVLTLLLVGAVLHFTWVGLPAYSRAAAADADLTDRMATAAGLGATLPALSHLDLRALQTSASEQADGNRRALAALLDASLAEPTPAFAHALRHSVLTTFDPLHPSLIAQAAVSPRAATTLARVLTQLNDNRIRQIRTLELQGGGAANPVAGIDGIASIGVSLSIESGLHDALALLEDLAPGAGEPVVTVQQASLAPVDARRWGSDLNEAGPPVRLTVSLAVLFAAPEEASR